jgi:hypothetical protein
MLVRRAAAATRPPARAPHKLARFRDPDRSLDTFDFDLQQEDEPRADHELATGRFIAQREDALFLGPPGRARVTWPRPSAAPRSSRAIASSIAKRTRCSRSSPTRRSTAPAKATSPIWHAVPLLIIDDLGMRKLPHTAAEDLLELIMRRYERASTSLTSNRPVDDWGKLLGDTAAVTALLDRLLHHAHVLKCGPRSWRTKVQTDLRTEEATK